MTEFEDVIAEALRDEASRVEISSRHAERIFVAAGELAPSPSRRERLLHRYGAARTLSAAVLSLALLAVVVVPLTAHENVNTSATNRLANRSSLSSPGEKSIAGAGSSPQVLGSYRGVMGAHQTVYSSNGLFATAQRVQFGSASSLLRIEQVGSVFLFVQGPKFSSTIDELAAFATSAGGIVSSSQTSISHQRHGAGSSGFVVLQVPAARFNFLINEVRGLGRATSLQTSATDVTGQYTDLAARIHAAQVSRSQYLTIMAQAHTIGAILSVQSQIDAIQSQIDRLQGELNVLSHETTFSTLTVNVSTPGSHRVVAPATRTGFSKAWHDAISGFLSGFQWVLRVAGPLAFVAVLLAAFALLYRTTRRLSWRQRG